MSPTIHFLFLLFTAAWPVTPGVQWRLVYQDGTVQAAAGAPHVADGKKVVFAWAWSDTTGPRRIDVAEIGKARLPADSTRLQIRIAGWNPRTMAGSRLIAAPRQMWTEVPEDFLPSWPVPEAGRLDLPIDPGAAWRVRLAGGGWGSWWTDVAPGQISTTVAPLAAPDLKLEIADSAGNPLRGSWMRLLEGAQGRRGGTRPWATYGPGQGRLEVPNLPDAEEVIGIFGAPEHAPLAVRGRTADLPRHVKLAAGATVSGSFTDDSNKPIEGARVYVESWLTAGAGVTSKTIETAGDGSWSLTGLPPGEAALWAQARGVAPYRLHVTLPEGKTDLGTTALRRGAAVRIAVVDDEGTPVVGAVVKAGLGLSAQADKQGVAVLSPVDPKEFLELTLRAARHLPREARIDPPFPTLSRIVIDRAFTIEGQYLDPHGAPVSEGLAVLRRGSFSTSASLRSDGSFELDLPAGEAAELALASPSTRELRVPIAAGLAGESRDLGSLRAPPGVDIVGRITSARTGEPVAGARVWLPRATEGGALLAWLDRNLIDTRSGADGQFRLTGAVLGPGELRVDAAGFARSQVTVQVLNEDKVADVGEIALTEGATLRVLVEGADSEAIARADLRGNWLELDMLTAPVQDGLAVLRNVPPGQAHVTVLQGRKLLCEMDVIVPAETEEETDVECSGRGLRVRGTVQVGGRRAGPGALIWLPPAPKLPARITEVSSPSGLRQQQVFGEGRPQVEIAVAEDGSFFTDELTAGAWQVSWVPASGSLSRPQAIELPDLPKGSEYVALLAFPGGTIFGAVFDSQDRPAEGARVREITSGAFAFAGLEGAFELTGLTPGKHYLQAEHDELASQVKEIEVVAGGTAEPVRLVLEERHDPEIQVLVLGPQGAPVPGAFVFLEEEGRGQRILTTGVDGRAAARLNPPAPTNVRLAAMANGVWTLGAWQPWNDIEGVVSLQIGSWGSLRIASSDRAGTPRILSPGGWDLAWMLTRLGSRPALTPGQPLEIQGLPVGAYTVSFEGTTATATVHEGKATELEVD